MSARRLSPEGGGHETVCQQGHWSPKGVDWGIPHRLKKKTNASEDTGCRMGGKGDETCFYKSVETSPYQTHFKTLREISKRTISAYGGLRLLHKQLTRYMFVPKQKHINNLKMTFIGKTRTTPFKLNIMNGLVYHTVQLYSIT